MPALSVKLDTTSGVFVTQLDTFMVNTEASLGGVPDSPWNNMPEIPFTGRLPPGLPSIILEGGRHFNTWHAASSRR